MCLGEKRSDSSHRRDNNCTMNTPPVDVTRLSRRAILSAGAMAGAATLLARSSHASALQPASGAATGGARKRALRFAHPTDIHVQPELRAGEGMAACFAHMMNLADKPELIITGGDLPMDTASTPEARSRIEWDIFKKVLADNVSKGLQVEHTLGNHDMYGRDRAKSGATGSEPFHGKNWFLQNFGYNSTYRSFDRAGWHFVILDSINMLPGGEDYTAKLDPAQMEWFKADLAAVPATTPIVVVSHVPIMSVANFFDKADLIWKSDGPDLMIENKRMHNDCRAIDALFQKHRNVKLCLSGHLHLLDRCVYNGVTYICDGAVSGAKWRGPKRQTDEGYGLIDLYTDGTFEHQYTGFGWVAERLAKPAKAATPGKPAAAEAE